MESSPRYNILKWNGKYGKEAVFVVRNNVSNKQSLFTPGRLSDLSWVLDDIASTQCKSWEDFGEEPCDDLARVVF